MLAVAEATADGNAGTDVRVAVDTAAILDASFVSAACMFGRYELMLVFLTPCRAREVGTRAG